MAGRLTPIEVVEIAVLKTTVVSKRPFIMVDQDKITVGKASSTSYLSLLDFFNKIGIYPCQKTVDETTKTVFLKPANGKVQLLTYTFILVILKAICVASYWLLLNSIEYNDIMEGVTEISKVAAGMQHSEFDFKLFLSLSMLVFGFSLHFYFGPLEIC